MNTTQELITDNKHLISEVDDLKSHLLNSMNLSENFFAGSKLNNLIKYNNFDKKLEELVLFKVKQIFKKYNIKPDDDLIINLKIEDVSNPEQPEYHYLYHYFCFEITSKSNEDFHIVCNFYLKEIDFNCSFVSFSRFYIHIFGVKENNYITFNELPENLNNFNEEYKKLKSFNSFNFEINKLFTDIAELICKLIKYTCILYSLTLGRVNNHFSYYLLNTYINPINYHNYRGTYNYICLKKI